MGQIFILLNNNNNRLYNYDFLGFLVGFFVSHLGVRKATFISALLLSAGCSISYIAPNVYVLYFTHGLFPGKAFLLLDPISRKQELQLQEL